MTGVPQRWLIVCCGPECVLTEYFMYMPIVYGHTGKKTKCILIDLMLSALALTNRLVSLWNRFF
jgi:hypothetical protein